MVTTTATRPKTFPNKVAEFVARVIRHRKLLNHNPKTSINAMACEKVIGDLTRNKNENYTDKAAARYFIIYEKEILFLIKQEDKRKMNQYRELLEIAKPLSII